MVIKGKARGGAAALAAHLQRHDTNEDIRVREFEGVTARDVLGALRELDAMGSGAASSRTLYHAAINTAPHEHLSEDQKRQAIDRLADELGFRNQPRVVVEHLKKDREHMHVVFLRIDLDRMVAIPDSHNYRKHEAVARDLERQFGHQPVKGAHVDRSGESRPARTPSHSEMQQAERSGMTPQWAKEKVTRLWRQADSGRAFAGSVTAEGWVLAKGDKRDFVLVDRAGETHSLARRADGAKAADIRQRMSDVDPEKLPSVAEAKEIQRANAEASRTKEKERTKAPHAVDPVVLKVNAPVEKSPALPLELLPSAGRPLENKTAAKPPRAPKEMVPEQKPAAEKLGKTSPVKQFYATAATTVQRVYEKARGVLIPKTRPTADRPASTEGTEVKPAPKLTPTQEAMRQRRAEARAADRQAITLTSDRTAQSKREKLATVERDPAKERKPKLSREEIEMMLARQRRQREFGGPSR